ncbi:MAG: hypothetical protein SWH54_03645 [Thermodesulfobacteriota bacterium]|nr:hypothetical protein [Thermodesulfobacteriota bacterium]
MKKFLYISLVLLIGLSFTVGCANMPLVGGSKKKTKTVSEQTLYSQVPESMRADVKEAEFDLQEAKRNLKLAQQKVKVGKLKKELGSLQKDGADSELEAAEKKVEEKELAVEVAKLEAIDNANLGDKIDNIKKIAKVKSKKLNAEADAVEAKAEYTTTNLEVKKLKKKIEKMEAKIKD